MNVAVLETWAWRSWSTNSCSRSAFIHEMQDHRPNRRVVWKRIKQADTQKQSWIQWEDASFFCERSAFRPNLLFGTTSMHIVKTLCTNYIDNLQNRFLLLLFVVVCVHWMYVLHFFALHVEWCKHTLITPLPWLHHRHQLSFNIQSEQTNTNIWHESPLHMEVCTNTNNATKCSFSLT